MNPKLNPKYFHSIYKCFRSTPNSSTTADSGVDNAAFRIETEGLDNGANNDLNQNANLEQEDNHSKDGNDNVNSNNRNRITSTTNINANSEHPDSAVWNKSPFSKKYRTHPPGTKGMNYYLTTWRTRIFYQARVE